MLDENIRKMRKEKGLTQEQLADIMGVSTASVSKWETGIAAPELTILAALADYFEMSIDALLGHTVDKSQLDKKIEVVTQMSLAGQDEQAMEQAEDLLRRFPNEDKVLECGISVYYDAFVHKAEREKMLRCIELVNRKYNLSKDQTGKNWFEYRARLANCYELLEDWEKAREYYAESNVSGVNDHYLARCLERMGKTDEAISEMSKAMEVTLFLILSDAFHMCNLWQEKNENQKAMAALRWGIRVTEGLSNKSELMSLKIMMLFTLAVLEQENEEVDLAKEHIRQAIRVEQGTETAPDAEFLRTDKPIKVIKTKQEGGSQTIALLTAMQKEELLAVAVEELEK